MLCISYLLVNGDGRREERYAFNPESVWFLKVPSELQAVSAACHEVAISLLPVEDLSSVEMHHK